MYDPCEKEQKEYDWALKEMEDAKKRMKIPSEPLEIETPLPSDLNALNNFSEKKETSDLKFRSLLDCKRLHGL